MDNTQNDVQNDTPPSGEISDNPTEWTTAQVVDYYKKAAGRTHNSVTSHQEMSLREGSLTAPGINNTLLGLTEDVMKTALKNNSMDFKGITGGHQSLAVSDVKSARAYKNGNNIIVEMTMKDQIDGKHGHNMSGTVGHAITVLGDVSVAVAEFPQFKIDTDNADIKIHYNNATVKVRINQNGIIEKGTWEYVSSVDIQNLALNFKDGKLNDLVIKKAKADVNYKIVLGGGF